MAIVRPNIMYLVQVWWKAMDCETVRKMIEKVEKLASIGITALEVLLQEINKVGEQPNPK